MRTALDPATPVIHPALGDNLAFERNLDAGAVDAAFAGSDEVVEAEFIFGRHTGVTLEPRAVVADWNAAEARLTIYQGTQAPHMVQNIAALHLGLGGVAGSRGLQGCRRLLRHQGPHLRRRDGDLCAVETVAPADQIRRRPGREFQHRYPCPRSSLQGQDRRQARRHHHRVRDRRSHRHRSLFDVSAHQRHRGQPGRQSGRRSLHDEELSRARPRRVPEQERDVPVPRGRPSHRLLGHRRPGRSRGDEDRHGPGGNPPPQSDCRRRLSLRLALGPAVRTAVASRRDEQADGDDGLRRACAPNRRRCARRISIAASASPVSSRSPIRVRRFTASAAPKYRRRMASRCGWTRRVR